MLCPVLGLKFLSGYILVTVVANDLIPVELGGGRHSLMDIRWDVDPPEPGSGPGFPLTTYIIFSKSCQLVGPLFLPL